MSSFLSGRASVKKNVNMLIADSVFNSGTTISSKSEYSLGGDAQ